MKTFIILAKYSLLALAINYLSISALFAQNYNLPILLDIASKLECTFDGHQAFQATIDLKFSYTCSDRLPNGPLSVYFQEIHKIGQGHLKGGNLHGEFRYFYARQTMRLPFVDGVISGKVRLQDPTNPSRSFSVDAKDDVSSGNKTFGSGMVVTYKNGLSVSTPSESRSKHPIVENDRLTLSASACERNLDMTLVNLGDFVGKLTCLKPNEKNIQRILTHLGIMRAEFDCENNSPNGRLKVYQVTNSSEFVGTMFLQGNLKNGSLTGDYKRFDYGYPSQTGTIDNGKLHGLITHLDSSGPVFSVQVKHGKCSSPLTFFDQSKFDSAKQKEDFHRSKKKFFVVVGVDGASGYGPPRFGPNLSILKGECKDACGGIGPTFGLYNKSRNEYYLGLAGGMAYMVSAWAELAVHSIDKKVSGFHGSIAIGIALMPFLELGYNLKENRATAKIGLTVKVPVYPLIK